MSLNPVSKMDKDPDNDPGTQICDLPVEMLAEVLDYLSSENRQKLRAICSAWNYVIGQLFETTLHVDSCNWAVLLETAARFLHVRISRSALDHQLNGVVNLSSFCSRIQKLELRALKLDLSCFRILQHATSLKELIVLGVHYWPNSDALKIRELEQTEGFQISTWLPELKTLKFESSNPEMLKLLAEILQKGGLENLAIGSNCRFSEMVLKLFGLTVNKWAEVENNFANEYFIKIIEANKTTLRKLASGKYSALEFNPRNALQFYVRKFRGALWFQPGGIVETTRSRSWLRILHLQECLQELHLECFQFDVSQMLTQESLSFEGFTSDIIARSAAYMTRVDLKFGATKEFLDPIFANSLDTVFAKCIALKYLKLGLYTPSTWDQYDSPRTQFKGITSLPSSLRHFQTSFPIATTEFASIDDLDLQNLFNLEQLEITSNIWFIFKNTPIGGLSLNQVKQLSLRLPKLKSIYLNIAHTRSETVSGSTENLKIIDPELVTKFKKSLHHKKFHGIFLKIEIAQL